MTEPEVSLQDPLAMDEIELYGELVIAATENDGPMDAVTIDAVLGVAPAPGAPQPQRRAG